MLVIYLRLGCSIVGVWCLGFGGCVSVFDCRFVVVFRTVLFGCVVYWLLGFGLWCLVLDVWYFILGCWIAVVELWLLLGGCLFLVLFAV